MVSYAQPLDGKVAVITGGAQGVGLGTAREFIAQGARVVITGLPTGRLTAASPRARMRPIAYLARAQITAAEVPVSEAPGWV